LGEYEIPAYAKLADGISGKDILDAITKSGYPFQAEVADLLRAQLSSTGRAQIQEEWAYIDSDTGASRSLDVFAEIPLWDSDSKDPNRGKVYPYLNLLIECKQSDLPYIFFLRGDPPSGEINFPEIAGVASTDIRLFIKEREGLASAPPQFSFNMSMHDVFACHNLEAFQGYPFYSISLAKAMRKGSKVELSGEETYRGLTFPLLKAADHIKAQARPIENPEIVSPRFIVCLAVIRAPLIGTYLYQGKHIMLGVPWVRACRVEPTTGGERSYQGGNVRYFDVVHSDFFSEYMEMLVESARLLAHRMLEHDGVVFSGVGLTTMEERDGVEEPDVHEKLLDLPEEYAEFLEMPVQGRITRNQEGVQLNLLPEAQDLEEGTILVMTRSRAESS
jgi:hypothetical protein